MLSQFFFLPDVYFYPYPYLGASRALLPVIGACVLSLGSSVPFPGCICALQKKTHSFKFLLSHGNWNLRVRWTIYLNLSEVKDLILRTYIRHSTRYPLLKIISLGYALHKDHSLCLDKFKTLDIHGGLIY